MVDHFWDAFKRPNRHAVNHPGFKSKVDVFFFMYAEKTREGLIKAAEQSITSFNSFPSARAVMLKHVLMIFRQNAGEDLYLEIFERFASDCSDQLNLRDEAEYVEKLSLLKPGLPAPEIVSSDLSGTSRRLSEFKGEPVLLFFWASWCPHCVGFIPRLKEVFSSHNLNVRIVAISLDDDHKSWQDAVNQHSMSHWINLSDLKRWKGSATQSYCVHRTPTMVLINSDGLIVARDPSPEDLPGLIR
jgi:thiol-disulfide isomerase/thioredoxin